MESIINRLYSLFLLWKRYAVTLLPRKGNWETSITLNEMFDKRPYEDTNPNCISDFSGFYAPPPQTNNISDLTMWHGHYSSNRNFRQVKDLPIVNGKFTARNPVPTSLFFGSFSLPFISFFFFRLIPFFPLYYPLSPFTLS